SILLYGTTTSPDWRAPLTTTLHSLPITILNPLNPLWDSTWTPDTPAFRRQVVWELDAAKAATVIGFWFGAETDAPISLLELGLNAGSGKCVVGVDGGYKKRGNVEVVCERFGIVCVRSLGELGEVVRGRVVGLLE
ncbi:hypothetical protein M011DRAFT_383076, partial [Sporormia fimetaria CBS 119925]